MRCLWSVVLAAGRGTRLSALTGGVPKQFWAPTGERSLLEETLERLAPLVEPNHIVTVVDQSHQRYVEAVAARVRVGDVIFQPADRGTAAGVLLATVTVWTCDPDAVVLITPSDHGFGNAEAFRAEVRVAAKHALAHPHHVILLGAQPQSAVGDYGWIVTRAGTDPATSLVETFVEKPAADDARQLFAAGAIWNTMVVVARAEALIALYRQHLPDLACAFEGLRFVRPSERDAAVRRLYAHLPRFDFSRDLLSRAAGLRCLACPASMEWTDLGTPERLDEWLTRAHGSHGAAPGVLGLQ